MAGPTSPVFIQPCGQRVAEKVAWARQIINRYGDLVDRGVIT